MRYIIASSYRAGVDYCRRVLGVSESDRSHYLITFPKQLAGAKIHPDDVIDWVGNWEDRRTSEWEEMERMVKSRSFE